MNRLFRVVILLISGAICLTAQPRVSLDKNEIDLGVLYKGGTRKASFTISNVGTEPLKILQVVPSCGCTALKQPKEVLQPGEKEVVEIEYNSSNARGQQSKRVDIVTNDPLAEYTSVRLLADVKEELAPENGTSLLWFGSMTVGTTAEQRIVLRNLSSKPMNILSATPSVSRISVKLPKKRLAPDETVEVSVSLTADKEGYNPDHIDLKTDSKNQPTVTINVSFIGLKGS